MTTVEAIRKDARDLVKIAHIVDHMRFNLGFNHKDIAQCFKEHANMELAEFEKMRQYAKGV